MERKVTRTAILIRISRLYRPEIDPHALYEATCGEWRLGLRRERAQLAMAVFSGVIREVYEIEAWYPAGSTKYATRDISQFKLKGRWEFTEQQANDSKRQI